MRTVKVIAIVILVSQGLGAASNVISGSISDEGGKPVSSAVVELKRIPESKADYVGGLASRAVPFTITVQAAADGSFGSSPVPAGKYYICAYPSIPGYLSNCDWTSPVPTVVVDGSRAINVPLKVIKGTVELVPSPRFFWLLAIFVL